MPSSTGRAGRVLERDVLEARRGPRPAGSSTRAGPVGDLLGLVDHLEDPLAGRGRALRLADPHAERCAAA